MRTNEGIWDRAFRILLGTGILSLTIVGPRSWWGLLGFVPLVTGITGHCFVYQFLGISTCEVPPPETRAHR